MGRSLSPLLRQELANLDKDADCRRSAMKALKTYAKDLDSKAIPHFLSEVSDANGATSVDCTISLYEVLARVHGRNIVPQIDNIMSTIMRTLSSNGGSFALHQACSKVVPAIARYGIDPSMQDNEKTRIISSLCKPLSDALMGMQESPASGAAFCLKALVESGNWRFATDEMVNEVCLKVAGALEEKATQTNAHMGLAMALAKHNGLIAEAFARSLVRSGLQILATGASESNSQKRLSAIQMINFLMKCVDPRSISTEVFRVIDVMEKCQADDKMPFVRGAAFEALQTAKALGSQNGSRHGINTSPLVGSNFHRRNSRSPLRSRNCSPVRLCSPESQTIESSINNDAFADSPASVVQSPCEIVRNGKRANRRLWSHDGCAVDVSLKDGLFFKPCARTESKVADFDQIIKGKPSDQSDEVSGDFSGFMQANESNLARDTTPNPQRSRQQLTMDEINIYSTPRKLVRSLQDSTDSKSECTNGLSNLVLVKPSSNEVEWKQIGNVSRDDQSQNVNSKSGGKGLENGGQLGMFNNIKDNKEVQDGTESVSSTSDALESNLCEVSHGCGHEEQNILTTNSRRTMKYGTAVLGFLSGAVVVLFAMILLSLITENDEPLYGLVPT
ncbi:protein SINE1-like [Curcuma longa]|uniref:protein SINE1-like n=1 Tax=Curcuma longa TaxID=136217 RepID=UPI003D9F054C